MRTAISIHLRSIPPTAGLTRKPTVQPKFGHIISRNPWRLTVEPNTELEKEMQEWKK